MAELLTEARENFPMYFPFLLIGATVLLFLLVWLSPKNRVKRKIRRLKRKSRTLTPEEFFAVRGKIISDKKASAKYNFRGVYVIYNRTREMYYVGQAVKILDRVNNHFTGHGNGDVYADYKYGNKFEINLIPLKGSGCKTLNELERKAIETYNAYDKGYNKTRGNHG